MRRLAIAVIAAVLAVPSLAGAQSRYLDFMRANMPLVGTFASNGVGITTSQTTAATYHYAWKGVTADTGAADFGLMLDGTPFFTGTVDSARDNMLIFGYNAGTQNTPPDTTEPLFTWNVEAHYVNNVPAADTHWLESYFQYVKRAGATGGNSRPYMYAVNRDTSASTNFLSADKLVIQSHDMATPYLTVLGSENYVYLGVNTYFTSLTNNAQIYRQQNAGGTAQVPLIWLDNGNFINLGHSTTKPAGIIVTQGTTYGGIVLPAGFAANYGAPLRFTAGVNMTTPYQGSMEYDGADLYFVPTAARGRETVLSTPVAAAAPAAGDCDAAAETNRMVWDSTGDNLYVCSGASGWRKIVTAAP